MSETDPLRGRSKLLPETRRYWQEVKGVKIEPLKPVEPGSARNEAAQHEQRILPGHHPETGKPLDPRYTPED